MLRPNTAAPVLAVIFFCAASTFLGASAQRVHLNPKFAVGQVLRYQITTRTLTTSNTTTPIVDSQSASQLKQTLLMQIRLEVLSVQPAPQASNATVRLRATYEKASASSETESYDPEAAQAVDQFNRLEGRSVEFTIDSAGKLSHIQGLDDLLANPVASTSIRSSIAGISASAQFPPEGIVIGQKWTSEQPLENAPLAGLVTRTDSSYVRDEAIAPLPEPVIDSIADSAGTSPAPSSETDAAPAPPPAAAPAKSIPCASIVTKFEIFRHGSAHGDATPPDYLHNGLRTSGTWTGSGESLEDIALDTGLLVRSTQTSSQNMDFEIVSPTTGSKIHYVGRVESQSEVLLLP